MSAIPFAQAILEMEDIYDRNHTELIEYLKAKNLPKMASDAQRRGWTGLQFVVNGRCCHEPEEIKRLIESLGFKGEWERESSLKATFASDRAVYLGRSKCYVIPRFSKVLLQHLKSDPGFYLLLSPSKTGIASLFVCLFVCLFFSSSSHTSVTPLLLC